MAEAQAKTRTEAPAGRRFKLADFASQFAPLIFLVVLVVIFAIIEPNFLTTRNIFQLLRQMSVVGLIAIGMTFVILTGGIDLSVGSLLAFAGMTAAIVAQGGTQSNLALSAAEATGFGVGAALAAGLGVGLLAGLVQGLLITRLGVPAFVVTLGGLSAFRGATLLLNNGGPLRVTDPAYFWWGQGRFPDVANGVPVPVILFFVAAIIAHIVLRYTRYGRHIYAVGGNPEAARLSGLNVNFLITSVYVIVGGFAGLGGFLQSSRLGTAEAVAGTGDELIVIASVVIGGTSLFGGEGSIIGTVIGAILIRVLTNGLVLLNVNSYIQQIIIGAIIILAVAFDRFVKSRRSV